MGEGLLLGLSWLDGSVSSVLPERKVTKVSSVFTLFVQSCRGKFLLILWVFCLVFCSSLSFYKASEFPNKIGYYWSTVFFVVKIFLLLFTLFCKRRVLICLLYLSPVCLLWVCWVRGNYLASWVIYFLCVCGSAVCSAGPVQFYSGTLLERMAGLYKFSVSLALL